MLLFDINYLFADSEVVTSSYLILSIQYNTIHLFSHSQMVPSIVM